MNIPDRVKTIIFIQEGGVGKAIASTAVVKAIKTAHPDKSIIVMTGYPDVFLYNPNVRKVFNFVNPLYFYEDYVNKETYVIKQEPYLDCEYLSNNKHIIQSWCDMIGVPIVTPYPDLYFLENELESAQLYINKERGSKGIILFQWIGGKIPESKTELDLKKAIATMYRRSLPVSVAQDVIDKLVGEGYIIKDIGHENFPKMKKAEKVFYPVRSIMALLKWADGFIGIDSFLQHAAASPILNRKGVVCWGGTSPKCLGYDKHINITKEDCPTPYCHRPNSYLFDVQPHGALWDCIHGVKCMKAFNAEEIVKAFHDSQAI